MCHERKLPSQEEKEEEVGEGNLQSGTFSLYF